jgi:hypothetical protein
VMHKKPWKIKNTRHPGDYRNDVASFQPGIELN